MKRLRWVVGIVCLAASLTVSWGQEKQSFVQTLTAIQFKEQIFDYTQDANQFTYKGKRPCVVDFYADWCGPCKKMEPIMNELSVLYQNKVDFYKINIDKEKAMAAAFGIQSIPMFLLFPAQSQPQIVNGMISKESFIKGIEEVLLSEPTKQ